MGFRIHTWSGLPLSLLSALFRGFTRYLLIRYRAAGAVNLILVLTSFFIVGVLFRAIGAGMLKLPRWRCMAINSFAKLPAYKPV